MQDELFFRTNQSKIIDVIIGKRISTIIGCISVSPIRYNGEMFLLASLRAVFVHLIVLVWGYRICNNAIPIITSIISLWLVPKNNLPCIWIVWIKFDGITWKIFSWIKSYFLPNMYIRYGLFASHMEKFYDRYAKRRIFDCSTISQDFQCE